MINHYVASCKFELQSPGHWFVPRILPAALAGHCPADTRCSGRIPHQRSFRECHSCKKSASHSNHRSSALFWKVQILVLDLKIPNACSDCPESWYDEGERLFWHKGHSNWALPNEWHNFDITPIGPIVERVWTYRSKKMMALTIPDLSPSPIFPSNPCTSTTRTTARKTSDPSDLPTPKYPGVGPKLKASIFNGEFLNGETNVETCWNMLQLITVG